MAFRHALGWEMDLEARSVNSARSQRPEAAVAADDSQRSRESRPGPLVVKSGSNI